MLSTFNINVELVQHIHWIDSVYTFNVLASEAISIRGEFSWINYAGTSLSCAGIQRWKSVSFHCWTAINLVGELRRRRRRTSPPTHPHPNSELWRVLHSCFPSSQWAVKSSTFLLALCLLWAGVVKHYTAVILSVDFSYCWINLEVLKYSLEQYIGFVED